jgi:2-methylcitrate dehydratase PrpD
MNDPLTLERFATELVAFGCSIGPHERQAAQICLADAIACAAVGVGTDAHRRSTLAFDDSTACVGRGAGIWFTGSESNPITAAYLNSVAVSAHDLDDGNRAAVGHPGGAVIPAVLAEAEATGSSVDPLDAIVVGYEAGVRLAMQRDPSGLPTMATGRWAGFASAAASCHLAGDDEAVLAAALAHAGALAPQLAPPDPRRPDGLKEGTPWGVVSGLMAARLARAGIPAPTYLLERHPDFGSGPLDSLRIGAPAAIHDTYFKRYACCRWIHPVIDALLTMHAEQPFVTADIDRIEIRTFARSLTLSNRAAPTTLEDAHYSFPFCVALALVAGPGALLPIDPRSLCSAEALALAQVVELIVDPELESQFPSFTPAIVTVISGNFLRQRSVSTAAGDPSLPFTAELTRNKETRLLHRLNIGDELAIALHAQPFLIHILLELLRKASVHP